MSNIFSMRFWRYRIVSKYKTDFRVIIATFHISESVSSVYIKITTAEEFMEKKHDKMATTKKRIPLVWQAPFILGQYIEIKPKQGR